MKLPILLTFFFLPFFITTPVSSKFHFVSWYCLEHAGNYTTSSTYQNNLNAVFSYLIDQASITSFSNQSKGDGIDRVYMLYNCRGDLNDDKCHNCVQEAAEPIVQLCPTEKESIVWYQECMVRYANRTIFSREEESPSIWDYNGLFVSNPRDFDEVLVSTMDGLIEQAAYNKTTKGYAIGEGNTTGIESFDTVYSFVRCTPDILGTRCERCLRAAFRSMAGCCGTNRQSLEYYFPSCWIRYAAEPFILGTGPPAALPVSPPPAADSFQPPSPTTGRSKSTATRFGGHSFIYGLILAVSMLFIATTSH